MQALPTGSDATPSRRRFLQALGLGALAVHADPVEALRLPSGAPRSPAVASAAGETTLGAYGEWAADLAPDPPLLSLRRDDWDRLDDWGAEARTRLLLRLAPPEVSASPVAETVRQRVRDGLHVGEARWPMPYGPPVEGVFLKPTGVTGPLPGVLALHDHGGDEWHGWRKVADADAEVSPMMIYSHPTGRHGRTRPPLGPSGRCGSTRGARPRSSSRQPSSPTSGTCSSTRPTPTSATSRQAVPNPSQ